MKPVTEFLASGRFFSPEIVLIAGTIVLLLASLSPKLRERRVEISVSAVLILLIAGALVYLNNVLPFQAEGARPLYLDLGNGNKILRVDKMGAFFKGLFLTIAALGVVLSVKSKEILSEHYAEYCALILSVTLGMILMATAVDMLMVYLAVETVSILSYVLAGFIRGSIRSSEASLKYMLYGALASGIMIYGMSILYGFTGTTNLLDIKATLIDRNLGNETMLVLAILFVLAGIGYKMAAVPFHFWCPDVYEGAPLPVTAFFSVGPKAAGFALAIRFFVSTLTQPFKIGGEEVIIPNMPSAMVVAKIDWVSAVFWMSILTMTLGNLAALRQKNAKRLFAYSSIAHAGYLAMGLTTLTIGGLESILFYLVVYTIMNLGAFYVVMLVADQRGSDDIQAFRGLFKDSPWIAIAMTMFLFSLTGIPPFAGFAGKLVLFGAVIEEAGRQGQDRLWVLAIIGVINSAISLFYYARVIRVMLEGALGEEEGHGHAPAAVHRPLAPVTVSVPAFVLLAVFAVPTLVFGLVFGWLQQLAAWTFAYAV
ncbi:MAG: NADH-quinone oxidoreductase subunit N [Bdellovibrionota bacterium]